MVSNVPTSHKEARSGQLVRSLHATLQDRAYARIGKALAKSTVTDPSLQGLKGERLRKAVNVLLVARLKRKNLKHRNPRTIAMAAFGYQLERMGRA